MKKGKVIRTIVSDVEQFTDVLARYLCQNSIRYVQIENEFHLSNAILRFYDYSDYEKFKDEFYFSGLDGDRIIMFDATDIFNNRPDLENIEDALIEQFTGYDSDVEYKPARDKGFVYTKRMRQRDNYIVNQRLKQNCERRIDRHYY